MKHFDQDQSGGQTETHWTVTHCSPWGLCEEKHEFINEWKGPFVSVCTQRVKRKCRDIHFSYTVVYVWRVLHMFFFTFLIYESGPWSDQLEQGKMFCFGLVLFYYLRIPISQEICFNLEISMDPRIIIQNLEVLKANTVFYMSQRCFCPDPDRSTKLKTVR